MENLTKICHDACVQAWWGRKEEKLETIGFSSVFEGSERQRDFYRRAATERAVPLLGHFGATLGSLWAYSGDFGSLYDYFEVIVELLWV